MKQNLQVMKAAFPYTIPVMAGYLTLGTAFGLLMVSSGYHPVWAFLMSVLVFAGSAQFLGVGLLVAGASLVQVAVLTFILNFRHFFYGLSMLVKYRGTGWKKWYLMFGLTDETYAILSTQEPPAGVDRHAFYMAVTAMNQSYWVGGSLIGALAGTLIRFNTAGLDFAMTALFAVLVVEQWKAHKNHFPALLGFGVIMASLLIFGPDSFLIPGLVVISALLLILRKPLHIDQEEENA